jgi:hypothetical protein
MLLNSMLDSELNPESKARRLGFEGSGRKEYGGIERSRNPGKTRSW